MNFIRGNRQFFITAAQAPGAGGFRLPVAVFPVFSRLLPEKSTANFIRFLNLLIFENYSKPDLLARKNLIDGIYPSI